MDRKQLEKHIRALVLFAGNVEHITDPAELLGVLDLMQIELDEAFRIAEEGHAS